jgi:hypothetical protein
MLRYHIHHALGFDVKFCVISQHMDEDEMTLHMWGIITALYDGLSPLGHAFRSDQDRFGCPRLIFGPSVTRVFHEVKRSCTICQYIRRRSAWSGSTYPGSRQYYRTMMCMKQRHRRRVRIGTHRLLQGHSLSLRRLRSSSSSTRG